jgi:hypothetical protein
MFAAMLLQPTSLIVACALVAAVAGYALAAHVEAIAPARGPPINLHVKSEPAQCASRITNDEPKPSI